MMLIVLILAVLVIILFIIIRCVLVKDKGFCRNVYESFKNMMFFNFF